jgi:hypothetical protein
LAGECGYFAQAHLTAEFAGLTRARLARLEAALGQQGHHRERNHLPLAV